MIEIQKVSNIDPLPKDELIIRWAKKALDKKNKEHKIEANLVLTGIDNDAKADLLKSGPLECQNIFIINSKDDYEILKNKLMEQYE